MFVEWFYPNGWTARHGATIHKQWYDTIKQKTVSVKWDKHVASVKLSKYFFHFDAMAKGPMRDAVSQRMETCKDQQFQLQKNSCFINY